MIGFVTGYGRSGTMWLAWSLQEAGIDARHETGAALWTFEDDPHVEIDSRRRSSILGIRDYFPDAPIILLTRDGRDVVRSCMARNEALTFEEYCASWAWDMERLAECDFWRVPVEQLWTAYEPFEAVVRVLGGETTEEEWMHARSRRVNATPEHDFPHWTVWSPKQANTFWRLAGDAMEALGYA